MFNPSEDLEVMIETHPEIKFRSILKHPLPKSGTGVYEVSISGVYGVLKIAPRSDDFASEQVQTEINILKYLDGKLKSPKIMGEFETDNYISIFKEKVPGDVTCFWKQNCLYEPAKAVIRAYHEQGVAGLDVSTRNFAIVDYNTKEVRPLDFGIAVIQSQDRELYDAFLITDYDHLDDIFHDKDTR